jgi:hypothetical protein
MCMSTTGFGVASSLGAQPLNSPGGYFDGNSNLSRSSTLPSIDDMSRRPRSATERRTQPRFDMNLKELFTDEELVRRPQPIQHNSYAPGVGSTTVAPAQLREPPKVQPPAYNAISLPIGTSTDPASPSAYRDTAPSFNPPAHATYAYTNQTSLQPFAEVIAAQQPDFTFDNLEFLDTFPLPDPSGNNVWDNNMGTAGELDLGFGTGGTAGWDGAVAGAEWGDGGGVDLFDGFFFGNGSY